ncbi:hypothetical protein F4677DRAFT_413604 [Hypoxylon crocopeplum]|nr:hypothetical protein F4677DRAFT_413604 [Hypoxylon crocopeplum]
MAGNPGHIPLNAPHRAQTPVHAPSAGARPTGFQNPPQQGLPRAAPAVNMARGPSVEISDVSRGLLTIDDMKEELTEYDIFRFEKMSVPNRYDDEGRLQLPTWEKAIRTQVRGMSSREIARQIQHLNRNTRSLADKLRSLSPVLQRQINAAQELLASRDPEAMNYHWNLVQLDHQLREIDTFYFVAAGGNHSSSRRHRSSIRRRSHPGASRGRRRSYERISLTAYFKRTPRDNVDIPALYEVRRRMLFAQNNHAANHNPGPAPRMPPQGAGHMERSAPSGPHGGRGNSGGSGQPAVMPRPNGPGPGLQGGNRTNNTTPGNRGKVRDTSRGQGAFDSDSDSSDFLASDGSLDTHMTPNTSQSSNGGNRRRDHGRDRVPAQNTGMRRGENRHDRGSPRHHAKPNGPRMMPTPGPPSHRTMVAVDIDRAYLAGIRDGRDDVRIAQHRALHHEARRPRPRPRIFQGVRPPASPYRRRTAHSDPEERGHRGDFEDEINRFSRLSLDDDDDDDDGYDTVLPRADARRRREIEYLLQHGSVLDEDPFDRDVSSSYARRGDRRYREPYVTEVSDSDFSPSPRGKRLFR